MLRAILLVNALALNLYRLDDYPRPLLAAGCLAVLVLWTGVATWGYADARRRGWRLLAVDLAVTVGLLLLTPVVKGADFDSSLPGFWTMAALLAWAVHYRWVGGLVAGVVLATTDLALRAELTQPNIGNAFLLLIGGPIVGYMCASLQQMASQRDQAERAAAAAAERARLARAVHDGVLQVLALVQRRGRELGGEVAELGRLAGEQETALRALIRRQDVVPDSSRPQVADLVPRVTALERNGVSVSTPGTPVPVPAEVADELLAAVEACLDNVTRHVGPDAPAWVLLEALPDNVVVTVRDEGPGLPPGRLAAAEREGRLGVSASIRGRIRDLGGTAEVSTGSWGTEWELAVPLPGVPLPAVDQEGR